MNHSCSLLKEDPGQDEPSEEEPDLIKEPEEDDSVLEDIPLSLDFIDPKSGQVGESEHYGKLLETIEWKEKRKEIIKRDHYVCQWCHNIIKLENLNNLEDFTDDPGMADIIREIFHDKEKILARMKLKSLESYTKDSCTLIEVENLYIHRLFKIKIEQCIVSKNYLYLISDKDQHTSFARMIHKPSNSYTYKYKENEYESEDIVIEYISEASTNNQYYIINTFDYSDRNMYRSQCLISCDGFTVVYPLFNYYEKIHSKFENKLQVHHKFYKRKLLPWEYANDDLITYCDNCHNGYHKTHSVKIID